MSRERRRALVLSGLAAFLIAAVVSYGIWSRSAAVASLQRRADSVSIASVHVVAPKRDLQGGSLSLPGEIAAWNDASIYGQVSGYITHWYKDIGASVKAGETLATIDAPGLDAQFQAAKANLQVAQARYNLADVTAKRFQALTESNGVSQQSIDNQVAAAAQQKAELASVQQTVNQFEAQIGFEKVSAPFDGIVTARRVNVGDFVNAAGGDARQQTAQPLFSVADVHKLRVYVSVPQSYGSALGPDLKATLSIYGDPAKSIPATFMTTSGSVDRTTRTINTELVLNSPPKELQPGAFVTVKFEGLSENRQALVVPAQAVLFRAQGSQVALVGPNDVIHLQSVEVGRNLGLEVQVLTGLTESDKVVANPSFGLLEGQKVRVTTPTPGYEPGSGIANKTDK